jgi:hypothetical protein
MFKVLGYLTGAGGGDTNGNNRAPARADQPTQFNASVSDDPAFNPGM